MLELKSDSIQALILMLLDPYWDQLWLSIEPKILASLAIGIEKIVDHSLLITSLY